MSWIREIDVVEEAIRAAGVAVARIAAAGFETEDKGGHTDGHDPVTTADLEANRILEEALMGSFPDYGWFSEETKDDPIRLERDRVWIVDPVDGTREFVMGIPEYGVSVALVENGQPVVGAVYNPAVDQLVIGAVGQGVRVNGAPALPRAISDSLVLVASRSERKRGQFEAIESQADVRTVGSIAYKHAMVAAGEADAVVSLSPKNEWDFAAGVLLVREIGGRVTDLDGAELRFNQANPKVNGLIAASAGAFERASALAAVGQRMDTRKPPSP